jgi:hypothetical protein
MVIQKWFVEISVEELDWPAQSPDLNSTSNTFGRNWNTVCEPGLTAQHQCPTSLIFLWLNGSTFLQFFSQHLVESLPRRVEAVIAAKRGTNSILMPIILE